MSQSTQPDYVCPFCGTEVLKNKFANHLPCKGVDGVERGKQ